MHPDGEHAGDEVDPRLERLVDAINDGCMLATFNPYTGAAEVGMRLFAEDLASRLAGSDSIDCAVPVEVGTGRRPVSGFLVVAGPRLLLAWEDVGQPGGIAAEEMDRAAITSLTSRHARLGPLSGWRTWMTVTGTFVWHLRVVDAKHGRIGRHVRDLLRRGGSGSS